MLVYLHRQNEKHKWKHRKGRGRPSTGRFSTMTSNQAWAIVNTDKQKETPSVLSVHIAFVAVQLDTLLLNTTKLKCTVKVHFTGFPGVTKAQFKSYVLENVFKTYTYLTLPRLLCHVSHLVVVVLPWLAVCCGQGVFQVYYLKLANLAVCVERRWLEQGGVTKEMTEKF